MIIKEDTLSETDLARFGGFREGYPLSLLYYNSNATLCTSFISNAPTYHLTLPCNPPRFHS